MIRGFDQVAPLSSDQRTGRRRPSRAAIACRSARCDRHRGQHWRVRVDVGTPKKNDRGPTDPTRPGAARRLGELPIRLADAGVTRRRGRRVRADAGRGEVIVKPRRSGPGFRRIVGFFLSFASREVRQLEIGTRARYGVASHGADERRLGDGSGLRLGHLARTTRKPVGGGRLREDGRADSPTARSEPSLNDGCSQLQPRTTRARRRLRPTDRSPAPPRTARTSHGTTRRRCRHCRRDPTGWRGSCRRCSAPLSCPRTPTLACSA